MKNFMGRTKPSTRPHCGLRARSWT